MRQFFASLCVVVLVACSTETASARVKGPVHRHPIARAARNHPLAAAAVRHAVHHPRTHVGWRHYCWMPAYRTYGYWCATNRLWFYWCQPQGLFLPVSSIATYPPTPEVNVINVNVNVTLPPGSPALPSGAVALPSGFTPPTR